MPDQTVSWSCDSCLARPTRQSDSGMPSWERRCKPSNNDHVDHSFRIGLTFPNTTHDRSNRFRTSIHSSESYRNRSISACWSALDTRKIFCRYHSQQAFKTGVVPPVSAADCDCYIGPTAHMNRMQMGRGKGQGCSSLHRCLFGQPVLEQGDPATGSTPVAAVKRQTGCPNPMSL